MRSRGVVVATVFGAALVSGGWLMQAGYGSSSSGGRAGAQLLNEVMAHVENDYVDTVSDSDLYRKAVDGLLLELHDPHSVYLTPDRLAKLNESTTGRYAGVGIQMDLRDGWITVVAPLPGTPAQRAGIVTGDRLVQIDGRSTRGWTSDEAMKAIRGDPGTVVHVMVERPGSPSTLPFTLTRQEIHFHSVQHALMMRNGIGYVDLTVFSEESDRELRSAIDSLHRAGMRGLIFDLREDPGGLLDQGVAVADLFLDPGQKIVSMRGRNSASDRDFVDRFPQAWPNMPMVVLVDSNTASAAEIVSGALQDHDRAVIVGTTSYGKGSAQSLFTMPEGGALKLTTALWYTPSGRSINKPRGSSDDESGDDGTPPTAADTARPRFHTDDGRVVLGGGGITPDVPVSDSAEAAAEAQLQVALGKHVADFRDILADYALELKAKHTITSPTFTVTPAMRNEVYDRLRRRDVSLPRSVFDDNTQLIDRLIGDQISRYVFGPESEFERSTQSDPAIATAVKLLQSANTPQALLREVATRH